MVFSSRTQTLIVSALLVGHGDFDTQSSPRGVASFQLFNHPPNKGPGGDKDPDDAPNNTDGNDGSGELEQDNDEDAPGEEGENPATPVNGGEMPGEGDQHPNTPVNGGEMPGEDDQNPNINFYGGREYYSLLYQMQYLDKSWVANNYRRISQTEIKDKKKKISCHDNTYNKYKKSCYLKPISDYAIVPFGGQFQGQDAESNDAPSSEDAIVPTQNDIDYVTHAPTFIGTMHLASGLVGDVWQDSSGEKIFCPHTGVQNHEHQPGFMMSPQVQHSSGVEMCGSSDQGQSQLSPSLLMPHLIQSQLGVINSPTPTTPVIEDVSDSQANEDQAQAPGLDSSHAGQIQTDGTTCNNGHQRFDSSVNRQLMFSVTGSDRPQFEWLGTELTEAAASVVGSSVGEAVPASGHQPGFMMSPQTEAGAPSAGSSVGEAVPASGLLAIENGTVAELQEDDSGEQLMLPNNVDNGVETQGNEANEVLSSDEIQTLDEEVKVLNFEIVD